ncbi:MAG: hypothetical protein HY646_05900 [Acidobacteria bacterium]|nr:hypothetical protein [Acidobacteriota bacterium]
MATQIKIGRDGVVRAVYDDRFRAILEALGAMRVERASQVEFESATGDWVARRILDSDMLGEEIARGKNRNDVIAEEVRYLEALL